MNVIPCVSSILREFHRHLAVNNLHREHGAPASYTLAARQRKRPFWPRFQNRSERFQAGYPERISTHTCHWPFVLHTGACTSAKRTETRVKADIRRVPLCRPLLRRSFDRVANRPGWLTSRRSFVDFSTISPRFLPFSSKILLWRIRANHIEYSKNLSAIDDGENQFDPFSNEEIVETRWLASVSYYS